MTKFPLERPPFPPINFINSDKKGLIDLAETFCLSAVEDYEEHLHYNGGIVDSTRWVRLKQFEDVVVYEDRQVLKERRLSRVTRSSKGKENMLNLLWAGTIAGKLDDVMYAVVTRTDEEAKVKAAFLESNAIDSALLSTLIHPTIQEPFRGLQVKWAVNAGPPMMRSVVRYRDFVYLEFTGTTTISTGERIGFHVLHSIVTPYAPDLHRHKLVRGNMTLYHVFRQKSDGVIDTYVKAFIDLMGDMPLRVATTLSTTGLVTVWRLADFALVKKLTRRWSRQRAVVPVRRPDWCLCKKIIRGNMARRRACKICLTEYCARCCVSKKMFFMPAHSRVAVQKSVHVCLDCIESASTTNAVNFAMDELSVATEQFKANPAYWAAVSPTFSTSSVIL